MPAEIDMTTGTAAMVFNHRNGVPWHGLGVSVDGLMTGEQVFEACPALDFTVAKAPLTTTVSQTYPPGLTVEHDVAVPDYAAVVRTDTRAVLGVVGATYALYQNRDLVTFGDAVLASTAAKYDTAGSLWRGRVVWVEMEVGEEYRVPGDESKWVRRLLVTTGHDGRHALTAKRTNTRVVCANTFAVAVGGAGATFTIRHTANMDVAVEDVRWALSLAVRNDEAVEAFFGDLAKKPISLKGFEDFVEVLVPANPEVERPWRTQREWATMRALFTDSPTLSGVPWTHYRALQAVGEYADHYRTYRVRRGATPEESRALSIMEGSAQALKDRAAVLLR
jgi:phage/plasmid-like protein (TIGR03299 family)